MKGTGRPLESCALVGISIGALAVNIHIYERGSTSLKGAPAEELLGAVRTKQAYTGREVDQDNEAGVKGV